MGGTTPQQDRRARARSARAGFTMIEMIMTLAIIGIVAAMALPKLDYTKYRVDAAARLVSAALQQAGRLAVQKQHDVIVSFDLANGRIRIIEDVDNQPATLTGERVTARSLEEGMAFGTPPQRLPAQFTGLLAAHLPVVQGMPSITFHRDGAASAALEIYVTSPRGSPNDLRGIAVTKATGRIDLLRYTDDGWTRSGI